MTVPSLTARIAVPMALAMSAPLWLVPQRAPKPEVKEPSAGLAACGAREAASAGAGSQTQRGGGCAQVSPAAAGLQDAGHAAGASASWARKESAAARWCHQLG